jgi:hypothetical protein
LRVGTTTLRCVPEYRNVNQNVITSSEFEAVLCFLLQGTASEATLVALLGAKAKALRKAKQDHPEWSEAIIISKLVGYASSK